MQRQKSKKQITGSDSFGNGELKIMNLHSIIALMIKWSVPFLNVFRNPPPWPFSFDELGCMEQGTLGRALYGFLTSREPGYLPKYEVHDAYHALLGYNTTVTDELRLQAFMWGNGNSTFAGRILFVLGYVLFAGKRKVLQQDIEKGRTAMPLKGYSVADMIPLDLSQLRIELCIEC